MEAINNGIEDISNFLQTHFPQLGPFNIIEDDFPLIIGPNIFANLLLLNDESYQSMVIEHGPRIDLELQKTIAARVLKEFQIVVSFSHEPQLSSEQERVQLEKVVRSRVSVLVEGGSIGINDINYVGVEFRLWSRICRAFGSDAQAKIITIKADTDVIEDVREKLTPLAVELSLPLKVSGTGLFLVAKLESDIERRAGHIS